MARTKATKAQLFKRREEIRELILNGVKKSVILSEMAEKHNTSTRCIREDIRIIGKEWETKDTEKVKKSRNKYLERLEMLLNQALSDNKIKVALDIQKEINKISGLYAEKEENQSTGPSIVKIGMKPNLKAVDGGD